MRACFAHLTFDSLSDMLLIQTVLHSDAIPPFIPFNILSDPSGFPSVLGMRPLHITLVIVCYLSVREWLVFARVEKREHLRHICVAYECDEACATQDAKVLNIPYLRSCVHG